LRVIEALILILAVLYVAASIYYIASDYIRRQWGSGEGLPNISNLPKNISGQDLYLTYSVKGYVEIGGSIISIDNARVNLNARYVEIKMMTNSTGNQTAVNETSIERYYLITAQGDPAILTAIRNLIMLTYNISDPNFSISQGWRANTPGEIFGNLSLFKATGSGEMSGRSRDNVTIKYVEYTFRRGGEEVVVWLERDTGIPLLCRVRTSWASMEFRLAYAS